MDEFDPILPRPDGDRTDGDRPEGSQNPAGSNGPAGRAGAAHQPPHGADLAEFPPRDEQCQWVRERLRARADDELEARERRTVDDHVHGCRDCGLALSRAELEVVRIRKALDADRAALTELPPDLTQRVIAAVAREGLAEEASWSAVEIVSAPEAPADFTRTVMDRVRREWRRPSWWQRSATRLGTRSLMAAAALVTIAAALAIVAGVWSRGDDGSVTGYEILRVEGVALLCGDTRSDARIARAGDLVDVGQTMDLAEGAAAELVLMGGPGSEGSVPAGVQPLAHLLLAGPAKATVGADASLRLSDGSADLRTDRAMVVALPGLGDIAVQPGHYQVSLHRVRRFDDGAWPNGMPRARVRVLDGVASIRRGGAGEVPATVTSGTVARYDVASRVDIERALDDALLQRSRNAGRDLATARPLGVPSEAPGESEWTLRVVAGVRGAVGVGDAKIRLVLADGTQVDGVSDPDGQFRFRAAVPSGSVAVVRVLPPEGARLATFGPTPRRMDLASLARRELAPIQLSADLPVRGTVRSADLAVVRGADITPCIVDEAFGCFERLDALRVRTLEDGRFVVHRLPWDLPPHQSLVLLVEAEGHPIHAVSTFGRRLKRDAIGASDLDVELGRFLAQRVHGLVAEQDYTLLREIPGVSLLAFCEWLEITADVDGDALVDELGPGRWWVVDGNDLRRLVPDDERPGSLRLHDELSAVPRAAIQRLSSLPSSPGQWSVAGQHAGNRFGRVWTAIGDGMVRFLGIVDPLRAIPPRTAVFAELTDGSVDFVGWADGNEVVAFAEGSGSPERLIGVAADGSLGMIPAADLDQGATNLTVLRPGTTVLSDAMLEAFGDDAVVSIEPMDGVLRGRSLWRRAHGGEVRDVPAGRLRVALPDGRVVTVVVEPGGRAQLEDR